MFVNNFIIIVTIYLNYNLVHCYNSPLFLTPLINDNRIEEAQKLAKVNLKGAENITSYAGLFTVNDKHNSNLFHWYFEAEEDPEHAPVLLWLNGGPGTTSMLGLLQENGPFELTPNNLQLKFRTYYWTQTHHVIYVDNPVGVGYSFTESEKGYARNTKQIGESMHKLIVQFFKMFPNLRKNDFYLCGESYGGKYVPATASRLLLEGDVPNFKGIIIGNGLTDPQHQNKGYGDYLYQQGFIDERQRAEFKRTEKQCSKSITNDVDVRNTTTVCRSLIDPFSTDTLFGNFTGYSYTYNILYSRDPTKEASLNREIFMNLTETRDAIHVGNLTRIDDPENIQRHLGASLVKSERQHVETVLAANKSVLIYNGQLDVMIPYGLTVNYIKTLNFTGSEEYRNAERQVWKVDDEVAGFIKKAGTLTEIMVIGAGHMVPMDQPKRALDLITRFTQSKL